MSTAQGDRPDGKSILYTIIGPKTKPSFRQASPIADISISFRTRISRTLGATPLRSPISLMSKVLPQSRLLEAARQAKARGQTVVHCHGCFDIVHPGHIRYLEFAKRQGQVLVVSLTGDSQIDKGTHRPYIPEEMRAENLAALECVDYVYIDPNPTARQLLLDLQPDIYIKGREYEHSHNPDFLAEQEAVESYGGRVLFSSGDVVFSSSRLIETMDNDGYLDNHRLALICKRHTIHHPSMQNLVRRFHGMNVLVVGDVLLDRYTLCDTTEGAGDTAMMALRRLEDHDRRFVGGAGAVARHLAALGAQCRLLGTGADDDNTRYACDVLTDDGIDACVLPTRSHLPEKHRFVVETQTALQVERGEAQPLDSMAEQKAGHWIRDRLDEIQAIIYVDHGFGTLTRGLLERIRSGIEASAMTESAYAGGPRGRLLHFKGVDLLCPSERDLRASLHDFDRGLSSVAWNAMDQTQSRRMLVTMGKRGLVAFDRESQDRHSPEWSGRLRSEYLPMLDKHVIDPLGIESATLAVATLALASEANLMQAGYLGQLAAALESRQLGHVPISSPMLMRGLDARRELTSAAQDQPQRPLRYKVNPATGGSLPSDRERAAMHGDVLSQVAGSHGHA